MIAAVVSALSQEIPCSQHNVGGERAAAVARRHGHLMPRNICWRSIASALRGRRDVRFAGIFRNAGLVFNRAALDAIQAAKPKPRMTQLRQLVSIASSMRK